MRYPPFVYTNPHVNVNICPYIPFAPANCAFIMLTSPRRN
nr:MAG TPA: hypothetical protein [Caudoviricetes sp.]